MLYVQDTPGKSHLFLQHVQKQLLLAGWQLRVLARLQPACGAFVDQIGAIAAAEATEAALAVGEMPGSCFPTSSVPPVIQDGANCGM